MKAKVKDRDLGFRELWRRTQEIKDGRVQVGIFADGKGAETYPNGGPTKAEVAVWNEYGTDDGRVPARPAWRMTFDAKREELASFGKKLIESVLDGKMEAHKALGLMGAKMATEIKLTITGGPGVPPPNAARTVSAKGSDRPLVDTGSLVNAITWVVTFGKKS